MQPFSETLVARLGRRTSVRRAELFVDFLDDVALRVDIRRGAIQVAVPAFNLGLASHDRKRFLKLGDGFLGTRQRTVVKREVVLRLGGLDQLQLRFDVGQPGHEIRLLRPKIIELLASALNDLPLGLKNVVLLLQQVRSVFEMIQAMGQLGSGLVLAASDVTGQTNVTRLDRFTQ